jgi:uncharacterized phage-associated protein
MPSLTSPAAVANAFFDIQAADHSMFPPIDQMKLQKLVFYSHAWWLAYNESPMFDDDVFAWPWGPVIPPLYFEFMEFGKNPIINKRATELVRVGPSPTDFQIRQPFAPPANVQNFLHSVWNTHRALTGIQLSNATHAQGEPWTIVKQQYGNLDSKPPIPNTLIRDVFRSKLLGNPAQPAAAAG